MSPTLATLVSSLRAFMTSGPPMMFSHSMIQLSGSVALFWPPTCPLSAVNENSSSRVAGIPPGRVLKFRLKSYLARTIVWPSR